MAHAMTDGGLRIAGRAYRLSMLGEHHKALGEARRLTPVEIRQARDAAVLLVQTLEIHLNERHAQVVRVGKEEVEGA